MKIFTKILLSLSVLLTLGNVMITTTVQVSENTTSANKEVQSNNVKDISIQNLFNNSSDSKTLLNQNDIYNNSNISQEFKNNNEDFQNIIKIQNNNNPHFYSFKFNIPEGWKLESSSDYLGKDFDTNEVYIVDNNNQIKYIIDKPWAKDANDNDVQTSFTIEGNKLTQNLDVNNNSNFPITADPYVWKVTKCAGSITWALGSATISETKVFKIKKYIKELGGLKTAVKLMLSASTTSEKLSVGGHALLNLSSTLLGIDDVKENCF